MKEKQIKFKIIVNMKNGNKFTSVKFKDSKKYFEDWNRLCQKPHDLDHLGVSIKKRHKVYFKIEDISSIEIKRFRF